MISITTYVAPPFEHQPLLYMVSGVVIAALLCWCRIALANCLRHIGNHCRAPFNDGLATSDTGSV